MGALSSLLVQDQVLGVTQIEQALQRQVILGGDLPTILLELRMLDERVLVSYMSRVVGIPFLTAELCENVVQGNNWGISKDTALTLKAVPVSAENELIVAVTGTLPPAHLERLAKESGRPVVPYLVLEFRFALLLNQVFGLPLSGRMSTLQKKILPDFKSVQHVAEKHSFDRPAAAEPDASAELENAVDEKIAIETDIRRSAEPTSRFYRGRQPSIPPAKDIDKVVPLSADTSSSSRRDTPLRIDDIAARVRLTAPPDAIAQRRADSGEKELYTASPRPIVSIPPMRASDPGIAPLTRKNLAKPLISFSDAAAKLENAANRDEIMETFFHFAHQAFDFTFLAVVHGDDASGRMAAYRGGNFNDADFVSIQLSEGGLFGKAFKSADYQIGAMDDMAGLSALNQLGLDVPLNAAVVPVVLKQRVILLLYGDSGHYGIRAKRVERISEFSKLVASAFERLLLARKLQKFSSVPPPPPTQDDYNDDDAIGDAIDDAIKVSTKTVARPKRDLSAFLATEEPGEGSDDASEQTWFGFTDDAAPDLATALARSQWERNQQDTSAEAIHSIDASVETAGVETADVDTDEFTASDTVTEEETIRVSVSPGKNATHLEGQDVTLKIHIEGKATQQAFGLQSDMQPIALEDQVPQSAVRGPAIRVIEPIRVTGTSSEPPLREEDVSPGEAMASVYEPSVAERGDAALDEAADEAADSDAKNIVMTAPYNVELLSGEVAKEGRMESLPSYVPRSTLTDGRYMQVDHEYKQSEKRERKHTVRGYAAPESLQVDGQDQASDKKAAAGAQAGAVKDKRQITAGYTVVRIQDTQPGAGESDSGGSATAAGEKNTGEKMSLSADAAYAKEALTALVDQLISGRFPEDVPARILAGGDAAIQALIAHFPGPLAIDRFQEMGNLSEISSHGPVLKTLMMFGNRVVPHVLPLLDSFDSEIRFYATFLFFELRNREILHLLVKRVFDNDRQIRAVAIDALVAHKGTFEYNSSVDDITMVLLGASTSLEKKRIAAEVLGQMREPMAVEALATMLGSVDGILSERCQRALVKTTFNDFGFSEKRWLDWYRRNHHSHPLEWAMEALLNKNEDIRRLALNELTTTLGNQFDWPRPPYDSNQRKTLHRQLVDWWHREGKSQYPMSDE